MTTVSKKLCPINNRASENLEIGKRATAVQFFETQSLKRTKLTLFDGVAVVRYNEFRFTDLTVNGTQTNCNRSALRNDGVSGFKGLRSCHVPVIMLYTLEFTRCRFLFLSFCKYNFCYDG